MKYLYNGHPAPELPAYSQAEFPYALIVSANEDNTALILMLCVNRPYYGTNPEDSTKTGVYNTGRMKVYTCTDTDEAWIFSMETENPLTANEDDPGGGVIWTRKDILKTNGSVWMAGREPVPMGVSESWIRSFKMGLALGLTGAPLPFPQKKLIGFLYGHIAQDGETPTHTINGVDYVGAVLPKVPEWDKEKYPYWVLDYAHTTIEGLDGWHWLPLIRFSAAPFIVGTYNGDASSPVTMTDGPYGHSILTANGGTEWGEFKMFESNYWKHGVTMDFANHDVLYANSTDWGELANTVRVPKSDPIPVYE